MRNAAVERKTKETDIFVALDLDGGKVSIETGIGFSTTCSPLWLFIPDLD